MDVRSGGRVGLEPRGEGCSTDSSAEVLGVLGGMLLLLLLLGWLLLCCSFTEKVGDRKGGRAKGAFPLTFTGEG